MRKIIRGFINGDSKPLGELGFDNTKIKRVYTIIDESLYRFDPKSGKEVPLESDDAHLEHLQNVFLEDNYHDWKVSENIFSFYGHSGSKGQKHDLLIILE